MLVQKLSLVRISGLYELPVDLTEKKDWVD